ncbi:MAG: glycosyltransferase, partial [Acetobacteraceae bacterium]
PSTAGWAEALRLALWLGSHEAGHAGETARLPFILTHRRADAETAPAAALGGTAGWSRRVRAALAQASGEDPIVSYGLWTTLFDHWSGADVARLEVISDREAWPAMLALVMCEAGTETEAARATLGSLAAQAMPVRVQALAAGAPLAAVLADAAESYVAILQAGEVLAPHATALLGAWLAGNRELFAVYADEDRLGADGIRHAPLFKPEPNRALMLSGTLTRGLWVFRRDWLVSHAPSAAGWAEVLRLALWLRSHEEGHAGETRRLPFILTHRRADAETAPAAALASVVHDHFRRLGAQARIAADALPLRVRPLLAPAPDRSVALIVPSALRAAHVRRCLRAVLERTEHAALELLLVVSQSTPLDAEQRATLAAIGEDPRLRVLTLPLERFNYSAANNFAAHKTEAEFLCLLNDDVAPVTPDWLDAMLGHFADPEVGAVGAKLLYENGTVQHGGIIMGLAGLAEHANRGLPRDAPGYAHRAVLSQEMSAATGACLLTRRTAYLEVGGLDESFPIAFNDVDFCLRLREAGHRIVFCAEAELTHYESLSLGHHFSGERAELEREEVRRMRRRWARVVAADPFHNPNLSLARGQEWQTAFPPRVRKSAWLGTPPPGPLPQGEGEKKGPQAPYSSPPLAGGVGGGVAGE